MLRSICCLNSSNVQLVDIPHARLIMGVLLESRTVKLLKQHNKKIPNTIRVRSVLFVTFLCTTLQQKNTNT